MEAALIVLIVIAVLLFVVVASSFKIINPYQQGVVEELGRYKATRDSGLRLIVPFIQRIRLVDMREQVIDVPPQEVITSDIYGLSVHTVTRTTLILLVVMSLLSWYVILSKLLEQRRQTAQALAARTAFANADSLQKGATALNKDSQFRYLVDSAMEALPEELRQAVTLREIEGLSYEEISEVMNCPIGTVRSRIFRAREAISAKVKPMLENQSGKRW